MDSQTSRRAFAVGVLLLLGIVGGMGLREWRASREAPPLATAPAGEPLFGTRLSDDAAGLWAELLGAVDSRAGRFTFQRLAALLSKRKNDPAAQAFVNEFMKDPELESIWRQFVVGGSDTGWLARRLTDSSRFAKLLNKHAQDRRFLALMKSLTAEARADADDELPAGPVAAFGGAGPSGAKDSGGKPGSRPTLPAWADRGGAGRQSSQGPGGAQDVAIAAGDPTPVLEERAKPLDQKAITKTAKGEEAPGAVKLAEMKAAGPSQDLNPWASLCYRENESISRAECSKINEYLGEDALWNACHKAQLLDRCLTLCQELPQLRCNDEAQVVKRCLAEHSAEECARACSAGPDCRVTDDPVQDPPPPVDDEDDGPEPVPMEAVMDGLRDIWANPGLDEADWPQFNGALDLVRQKFQPPPEVLGPFQQKLQQIIQHSPTCNDPCEMQKTADLIRETFGGQLKK